MQTGLAGSASASVPAPASQQHTFGDLPTVRAMGSGERAPVIGFDTEFTYLDDGSRIVDSYQFSCVDPESPGLRVDVVLLPLEAKRLAVGDALAVVIRESGLWSAAGLPDPRGIPRRGFWVDGDYRASVDALYRAHRLSIVLAGHYLKADLTAFARPVRQRGDGRYDDILRRVTSASGGLVSLKPIRMMPRSGGRGDGERWLPLSIIVRDTMCQAAPGKKRLKDLGDACGVAKLDVGDSISDMSGMRRERLVEFLEYGANDAVIVVEYLAALWGLNAVPPVTLSGGGAHALRDGIKRYWDIEGQPNAEFMARFQGLVRVDEGDTTDDDGLSYYSVRSLTPVDGDANQAHSAFKKAFHGGWNACLRVGYYPTETYDHDIQSAYPSAMASVVDVDFEHGCIEEVIKDRDLVADDFPLGVVTPLVAYVAWEFPEGVEPCIPVRVGQSIIYPRTSEGVGAAQGEGMDDARFDGFEGAWVCGPELALALALGARVRVQIGYRLRVLEVDGAPSRSMRAAVRQMVEDRAVAKKTWGKGSLEEQTIKVATNSCYGKLAQDVAERSGWNAWAEEMESIGGSSVTSPYHAAMITSLVRALLLAMANEVSLISVTTDGFITEQSDVEGYDCFGHAGGFREARDALVGDPTVWEVKHRQDDLINLTTRGNVSLDPGGVIARAGLRTPDDLVDGELDEGEDPRRYYGIAEREWFRRTALTREGKVENRYTSFPSFRELSRTEDRVDFHPVERSPQVSLDFDMKRRPLMETLRVDVVDGHEMVGFDTAPWDNVCDYQRARDIARHIAAQRPGTTGEDRPTGCLRTREDWLTWQRRYEAASGRRIRTAGSALLSELVAAHKEGLVSVAVLASRVPVDQKLSWLSSLGYGEFSRAQWDHMSKRSRRDRVLADLDLDALVEVVEGLPQW
ncbi:hypothetical protein JRG19_03220 [Pseudoclavibacter alba]|uniref:hypothetical protein n=1 Tax=Pseudoclavibacter albus TaxID=272241 RepID=UPI0019D03B8C|nr:hypothetical protein [Pseudoclavibacter alba]MBN6777561.1 hypothetical protein [Pseudoclavibacter alba]